MFGESPPGFGGSVTMGRKVPAPSFPGGSSEGPSFSVAGRKTNVGHGQRGVPGESVTLRSPKMTGLTGSAGHGGAVIGAVLGGAATAVGGVLAAGRAMLGGVPSGGEVHFAAGGSHRAGGVPGPRGRLPTPGGEGWGSAQMDADGRWHTGTDGGAGLEGSLAGGAVEGPEESQIGGELLEKKMRDAERGTRKSGCEGFDGRMLPRNPSLGQPGEPSGSWNSAARGVDDGVEDGGQGQEPGWGGANAGVSHCSGVATSAVPVDVAGRVRVTLGGDVEGASGFIVEASDARRGGGGSPAGGFVRMAGRAAAGPDDAGSRIEWRALNDEKHDTIMVARRGRPAGVEVVDEVAEQARRVAGRRRRLAGDYGGDEGVQARLGNPHGLQGAAVSELRVDQPGAAETEQRKVQTRRRLKR